LENDSIFEILTKREFLRFYNSIKKFKKPLKNFQWLTIYLELTESREHVGGKWILIWNSDAKRKRYSEMIQKPIKHTSFYEYL
jgi:predicted Abi (CAAX) family protease